jgi:hypothetical protein
MNIIPIAKASERPCLHPESSVVSSKRCRITTLLIHALAALVFATPVSSSFSQGRISAKWTASALHSDFDQRSQSMMQSPQSPAFDWFVSSQERLPLDPFATVSGDVGAFLVNPYPSNGSLNDIAGVFSEIDASTGEFLRLERYENSIYGPYYNIYKDKYAIAGCEPSEAANRKGAQPCPSANYTVLSSVVAPGSCIALYACRAPPSTNITRRNVIVAVSPSGAVPWEYSPSDVGQHFANDSEAGFAFWMQKSGSVISVLVYSGSELNLQDVNGRYNVYSQPKPDPVCQSPTNYLWTLYASFCIERVISGTVDVMSMSVTDGSILFNSSITAVSPFPQMCFESSFPLCATRCYYPYSSPFKTKRIRATLQNSHGYR